MKLIPLLALVLGFSAAQAAPKDITYFSCSVKEGRTAVKVKFAIENFDPLEVKGDLIPYPGTDEDMGYILVTPQESGDKYVRMINLNGQGGDLRILSNGDIHLFGDGDGYQFTDLILWDDGDEELAYREGYIRDYGPAYAHSGETFKQFITCEKSKSVL